MAASAVEGFINCKSGADGSASSLLDFQFNKKSDVERNMWYLINSDFKAPEWAVGYDITVEDGRIMDSARQTDDVTSFKQTLESTLTNDNASAFLKRLYFETLHGDTHFKDLLDHGINARITNNFPDGSSCIKQYNCCTVTNPGAILEQLQNADAENEFNLTFNRAPEIMNVGISSVLPKDVVDVDAVVDIEQQTGMKVSVTISNVIDNPDDPLIAKVTDENKTWFAGLYDATTRELVSSGTTSGKETGEGTQAPSAPIELTAPKEGKYIIVVGYAYTERGNTIDYNTNVIKTLDITNKSGIKKVVQASTMENEVSIVKNAKK